MPDLEAVIFDLDGVVTDTARAHRASWKRMFDAYLRERLGEDERPFSEEDYLRYVDGRPRYEGVRCFLASRGLELPYGQEDDPPGRETLCGLGNLKNVYYHELLDAGEIDVIEPTVAVIDALRNLGVRTAIVSSSRNCRTVLERAGLCDLFEVRVDGTHLVSSDLRGKPHPDMFLEAARRLGVTPAHSAVVEDATSGVEAGRRGEFGWVIGIARGDDDAARRAQAEALRKSGAHMVFDQLTQWKTDDIVAEPPRSRQDSAARTAPLPSDRPLPHALDSLGEVLKKAAGRSLAVFLDYDGTLTPIVSRPEDAVLAPEMKHAVEQLAAVCTVAVISGRDLEDVRGRVGLDGIAYAGSHGFDLLGPDGTHYDLGYAERFADVLDAAAGELRLGLEGIEGAQLEQKRFSLAAHYRRVTGERDLERVSAVVDEVLARHPELRLSHGKKVYDLQPAIDWHKGRAVEWLLERLRLDDDRHFPIYLGDDVTDEDAFEALEGRGLGIVVRDWAGRSTAASYELRDVREVRRFLERLARRLE